MNRIREIRKQKNISQAKIAKFLNTTPQSISLYEKGQREPKITTWQKLAEFFEVPVPYLMGLTATPEDDPDGWKQWEINTGYSRKKLESTIQYLIETDHLTGDEPLYDQINTAVTFLIEGGNDASAKTFVSQQLFNLMNQFRLRYEDPQKVAKLPNNSLKRAKANVPFKDLIFDDMDADAYQKIYNILKEARDKI